jgi:hypothetical protein
VEDTYASGSCNRWGVGQDIPMSRTSWKPQRALGSAALACTLILTSAVPALGAVSNSPVAPVAATYSAAPASGAPAADVAVPQPALTAVTPRINGTAKVGQQLTAIVGAWTPGTVHTYQWYRNGSDIRDATVKTYTPTAADYGRALTVRVTGSKSGYATTSVASAKTQAVAAGTLSAPKPTISGTPKVGRKLTAIVGKWTADTTLKYQWYRNGSGIKGATAKSYTATASDRGTALTVRVTGSKTGYATKAVTSAKTGAVVTGTLTSAVPKISGTAKAGSRLSVSRGNWTSGTKLTQRWYRNGTAISGATGTSYTLKSADSGTTISVKVTGSRSGYTTVTKASAGVRVLAAAKPKPASNRAAPRGKSCPSTHPIKGNADSGIYHVPTGAYYGRTVPEACFTSESAAKAAGYRKSKL